MLSNKHEQELEKVQRYVEANKINTKGKTRQEYHFMPQTGWMNDPNGLIWYKNKYHFFYQYNPYEPVWGKMYWGHAISENLVDWTYLPIALAPSEPYDNDDRGGCFSGSAIEHEGRLYLMYTGTVLVEEKLVQTQCIAYSEDGVHFEKYAGNPVVTAPKGYDEADFRDPKVWEHEGCFYMVCGTQKEGNAQALIYRSKDLLQWEYMNVLVESFGEWGSMWECPDIYPIGDKYIFQCSPIGTKHRKAVYFVGDLNYKTGKFTYTVSGELDWGTDYYAAQSFSDSMGRRLIVGWANGWDWMPWWKDFGPTHIENWCGFFALPREVKLEEDGRLAFYPIAELEQLRNQKIQQKEFFIKNEKREVTVKDSSCFEMLITIDLDKSNVGSFEIVLKEIRNKKAVLIFDLKHQMMYVDRTNADDWDNGISQSPLLLKKGTDFNIHVFVDRCSVEVFTDQYKTVHSCNVFVEKAEGKTFIEVEKGELYIKELYAWDLKR